MGDYRGPLSPSCVCGWERGLRGGGGCGGGGLRGGGVGGWGLGLSGANANVKVPQILSIL